MSRRRFISTEISTCEELVDCVEAFDDETTGILAELVYERGIPHCDDQGILKGTPREIKALLFPLHSSVITAQRIALALEALDDSGLILWAYEDKYVFYPFETFYKYQTYVSKERRRGYNPEIKEGFLFLKEGQEYPNGAEHRNPDDFKETSRSANQRKPAQTSVNLALPNIALPNITNKPKPYTCYSSGENGKAKKKKSANEILCEDEFLIFWVAYPRPMKKADAVKRWNARIKDGVKPESMIASAQNYSSVCSAQNRSTDKIMHPTTFLGPCSSKDGNPFEDYLDEVTVARETGGLFVSSDMDLDTQKHEIENMFGGNVREWSKWVKKGRPTGQDE